MYVTKFQHQRTQGTFEKLFEHVRKLRSQGYDAPSDDEFERLFTDLDEYEDVHADESVQRSLHLLQGLAVGLGFETTLDLYIAYDEDRLIVGPDPTKALADSADKALGYLGGLLERGAREIVNELGEALSIWRGRPWR